MATQNPALYEYSMVPFLRTIKTTLHVMDKAEQYAKEKGENVDDYLQLQLHPDMKPFVYQIQRISDSAKFAYTRVTGVDTSSDTYTALAIEDNETTWADCRARLDRTVELLTKYAKPAEFEGKEGTEIILFGGKVKLNGQSYLQTFAIPNFYFHATTAYDLLRQHGVPIGKWDFLAGVGQS